MGFKKVNTKEEIERAIKERPELAIEIEKANKKYEDAKINGKKIKK